MNFANVLFRLADVSCEVCQEKLTLSHFRSDFGLICKSCGHTLQVEQERGFRLALDKSLVRPSDQVQVQRKGSIFILERKWFSKKSRKVLIACVLFNSFVAYELYHFLHQSSFLQLAGAVQAAFFLFGVGGLFLIFKSLQQLFNTTTVMIKSNKVVVGTGPFSFSPVKIYNVHDISNFNCWKSKQGVPVNKPVFSFGLDVHFKDGKRERLVPASDLNEAVYLEKTIEELLAIEEAVPVERPSA